MNPFKVLESINAKPFALALVVPVLLGMKPASKLEISGNDEDTEVIARKFEEMGLKTKVVLSKGLPRGDSIYVAKSAEILKKLLETEATDDYNLGLLYGYPESAVKAFVSKDFLAEEDEPPMDESLFPFRLSKENWQEELKVMEKWNNAVKEYTPKIYEKFIHDK